MESDAIKSCHRDSTIAEEDENFKEASSPMSPRSERQRKFTRFLVEEILKPEFGIGFSAGKLHRPFSPERRFRCLTRSETGEDSDSGEGLLLDDSEGERGNHKTRGDDESMGGLSRVWPAWVYCTRYSDRPSSGPRVRKPKKTAKHTVDNGKRPRTSFTNEQLKFLKQEFDVNRYLNEERRQKLAKELDLNESQVKIWFQNKRAKAKKGSHVTDTGTPDNLAVRLMAEGLYNHSVRVSMSRKV